MGAKLADLTSRPSVLGSVRRWLPRGSTLPDEAWAARHRAIVVLLWGHAIFVPAYALIQDFPLLHGLLEGSIVLAAAVVAAIPTLSRRLRTAATSVGLLSSSAVLVHLSGGLIEMHFHFFVMVAVVALYQDWLPFLASIAYVLVHHGALGALDANSVYNHPAAQANPWKWATVHALFIAGISVACLVTWRLNEVILAQRIRAEERLREETHVVETLHEVGKTIAADLDVGRVVQFVTDTTTRLTGAAFGAFFYNSVDASGESYVLYAISGVDRSAFERFPLPRNTDLFGPTFRGEGVVRLDDVTKDHRFGRNAPHHGMPPGHLPVCSYLAVPVKSRTGEVLGGLFFGHPEPARFDDVDERIVVGIASQAAVAMDNARLFDSERHAREASERAGRRLTILAEASRVLTASLELDALVRNLGQLVSPGIADSCVIDLRDEGGSVRRAAVLTLPELEEARDAIWRVVVDPTNDSHPVVKALRTGETQVLEQIDDKVLDDAGVTGRPREILKDSGFLTAAVVPLVGREEAFGALSVTTTERSGRRLSASDIQLVEELARRAASAIENARLYARQRSAAEMLQHSLLPEKFPEIPGVVTAARYMAGGTGLEIGGDWYDVFEVPDGSLVLVMGDVVGRGVAAAALMGQLRNALRAYALEGDRPGRAVRKLNQYLHQLGPAEHMATLIVAKYHPESGDLVFTNAGHPPPLLIGADGSAEYLEVASSIPVGAVHSASYPEATVTLDPESTLLLYTDGLVESRDRPLDEGMEDLRAAVAEPCADLEVLCDRVVERALGTASAADDVAILALRALPLGERLTMRLPARPTVLKPLRATLRRWLHAAGAAEDEVYEILVASGEACANAIQHATGAAGQSFDFEATSVDGREIVIAVRDHGRWRKPRHDGGGRGIGIMREFMDDVEVNTGPDGTQVRMRRAIAKVGV